jgi:hypothetical protein
MEEIASEFADDDVRASGLSVGSSSAKSTPRVRDAFVELNH